MELCIVGAGAVPANRLYLDTVLGKAIREVIIADLRGDSGERKL